jgi:hypothetical protein
MVFSRFRFSACDVRRILKLLCLEPLFGVNPTIGGPIPDDFSGRAAIVGALTAV